MKNLLRRIVDYVQARSPRTIGFFFVIGVILAFVGNALRIPGVYPIIMFCLLILSSIYKPELHDPRLREIHDDSV